MAEPFAIEEVCWMHWLGESLSIVIPPPLIKLVLNAVIDEKVEGVPYVTM